MVATLSPRADVPPSVRKLPEARIAHIEALEPPALLDQTGSATAATLAQGSLEGGAPACSGGAGAGAIDPAAATADLAAGGAGPLAGSLPIPLPHPHRSAEVRPLSPDRYEYQLTIGGSTLEKLHLAKDMLRHALPSGDDEAILDRALTALLDDLARKKFGAERQPGSPEKERGAVAQAAGGSCRVVGLMDSRHVPVEVKRAVWVRDLGRCAFVATDGHRCGERGFVEFHHVRPYAVGGRPTVDNIQLRCRRHNGYEARVYFAREAGDRARRAEGQLVSDGRGAETGHVGRTSAYGPRGRSRTTARDGEPVRERSRFDEGAGDAVGLAVAT